MLPSIISKVGFFFVCLLFLTFSKERRKEGKKGTEREIPWVFAEAFTKTKQKHSKLQQKRGWEKMFSLLSSKPLCPISFRADQACLLLGFHLRLHLLFPSNQRSLLPLKTSDVYSSKFCSLLPRPPPVSRFGAWG